MPACFRVCAASFRRMRLRTHAHDACASSPFHIALLLSKNLRLSTATKRQQSAPVTGMPASFSCQRPMFRSAVSDRNISAPGGAQYRFGADTANNNKKPGVERRACPSFRLGCLLVAQPPERMCSKLVLVQKPGVRNQPHLVISERARFVRGLPCKSGLRQHPESISASGISSSVRSIFFGVRVCGIHQALWKSILPDAPRPTSKGDKCLPLTNSLSITSSPSRKHSTGKGTKCRLCDR